VNIMANEFEKTPPEMDPDEEQQAKDDAAAMERIWDSPLPIGEAVDFDPEVHKPILTPEEIEKALKELNPN
jgi:hypothetical protein